MAAGLQRYVDGGPGGVPLAVGQGGSLSVEVAAFGVVPLADHLAILYDDRPHHGVGAGPARALAGQVEGQGHILFVCCSCCHGCAIMKLKCNKKDVPI